MNPIINDQYVSYQGSGHLIGKRQYFIRFAGCSIKDCRIRNVCDEKHALSSKNGTPQDPSQLVQNAVDQVGKGGWIAITGGEPCDQPEALAALCIEAERKQMRIHLHTSGAIQVPVRTDWLTISPKHPTEQLSWNRNKFAQEMIIVCNDSVIDNQEMINDYWENSRCYDYYLQPEMKNDGTTNLQQTLALIEILNGSEHRFDLTVQMHKYLELK